MEKTILEMEKSLFKYEYMSNKEYLNNILDDRYEELGKSGKKYNKHDVISKLNNYKSDRNIVIYNYTCKEISKDIWIIHYITLSNSTKFYRTSIWKKDINSIKIVFHQASEYKEDINLVLF